MQSCCPGSWNSIFDAVPVNSTHTYYTALTAARFAEGLEASGSTAATSRASDPMAPPSRCMGEAF